ncbi:MAG: iron transporter [Lachnospiraceae bacterium]|nr:iron transporter [Lachnospiraceae bacterium]
MIKKALYTACVVLTAFSVLAGCGQKDTKESEVQNQSSQEGLVEETEETQQDSSEAETESTVEEEQKEEIAVCPLEDGIYSAKFDSDSSMFRVSEACEGRGILTVQDGKMSIHISLTSKKILNLYYGLAEDAQKEGAVLLEPVTDTVTYSDGLTDEVNGFDVPVPYLDEEFDLALVGTKGTWYDHKVRVSDVQPAENAQEAAAEEKAEVQTLADGTYQAEVTLTGGSGKATITSPAVITVKDGKIMATLVWTSPNYDYMIVEGEKYLNEAEAGENSTFTVTVSSLDTEIPVIGDTVAMSKPHEVEYTLCLKLTE